MKLKCLDIGNFNRLRVGTEYEVTSQDDMNYILEADGSFIVSKSDMSGGNTSRFMVVSEYAQHIAKIKEALAQIEEMQDKHVDEQLMNVITKLGIHIPTLVEELETMWDLRNIFQGKDWSTNEIGGFADWMHNHNLSGCQIKELADSAVEWESIMCNDASDVEDAWEFYKQFERAERDWLNENDVSNIKETVENIVSLAKDLC